MDRPDRLRCVALGVSTAALVLVPTLGPVLAGTEEGAEEFDTDITPPDYAFAIWAPIFATSAASTIQHIAHPTDDANRRHGWWLAGAHAANAAWSLAAQSDRFRYTAAILPIATALAAGAHRQLQGSDPAGIAPHSTGLLLGWTSVASVVNVFAVRKRAPHPRTTAAAVVGAAAVLAGTLATSRRGYVAVAAAGLWALTTSAFNTRRTRSARVANAVGATLVATTAATKLWRDRGETQGAKASHSRR
ncbi:hypothetical protein [Micromonospora sp. WMMD736]|uniref:hypothetical protein n=1 Tax=Micromonospora sp. WMMD736 TaxID=3404112 RepID=UPI003B96342B